MKNKVVIVYSGAFVGGSTTSLLGFLDAIDYLKHDVTLVLFSSAGPLFSFFSQNKNIKLIVLNDYSYIKKRKLMSLRCWIVKIFFTIFSKIIKKANLCYEMMSYCNNRFRKSLPGHYDVAISFLEGEATIFVATKISAKKKAAWLHVNYEEAGFLPKYDVRTYSVFDRVVTVSPSCLASFCHSFPSLKDKGVYIPNLLSEEVVRARSQEPEDGALCVDKSAVNLITSCRLTRQKGLDRAIFALGEVQKTCHFLFINWYIIGDGPEKASLIAQAKKENVFDHVFFLGEKANPFPYYREMDAFFLPSRYEGRPMAVDEALALGVPCVVTDYSSAHSQIAENQNGFIVGNDENSIYQILLLFNRKQKEAFSFNFENRLSNSRKREVCQLLEALILSS